MENNITAASCTIPPNTQNILNWKVGDLVSRDFRTTEIFIQHKIDYCCGGKKTVLEACSGKNLDTKQIQYQLQNILKAPSLEKMDTNRMDLGELTDHIVRAHHGYVQKSILTLSELAEKVVKVHGHQDPELIEIKKHFTEMANDLIQHMKKEELIIFPYIKNLTSFAKGYSIEKNLSFVKIDQLLDVMESEHDTAAGHLNAIHQLSQGYLPPTTACTSYKIFYAMLKAFETDLHLHVHLENNILFPGVLKL